MIDPPPEIYMFQQLPFIKPGVHKKDDVCLGKSSSDPLMKDSRSNQQKPDRCVYTGIYAQCDSFHIFCIQNILSYKYFLYKSKLSSNSHNLSDLCKTCKVLLICDLLTAKYCLDTTCKPCLTKYWHVFLCTVP